MIKFSRSRKKRLFFLRREKIFLCKKWVWGPKRETFFCHLKNTLLHTSWATISQIS